MLLQKEIQYGILIDFDRTITVEDTLVYLLDRYGMKDWKKLDDAIECDKITGEEALRIQMKSLRITPENAISELLEHIPIREGFREFLAASRVRNLPVRIVSGGFVEIIAPYLKQHEIECEVYANHISGLDEAGGWEIECVHESLPGCKSLHCKCLSDEWLKKLGREAIFIGDGITDYCVSERVNIIFALAGDALARKLQREQKHFFSFTTFFDVIDQLGWNQHYGG